MEGDQGEKGANMKTMAQEIRMMAPRMAELHVRGMLGWIKRNKQRLRFDPLRIFMLGSEYDLAAWLTGA
jgi:hypothetical protein